MLGGGYFEPELIILDLNIPRIAGMRYGAMANPWKFRWWYSVRRWTLPKESASWN